LKGKRLGAKKSFPIDFREQQGVYCLYDDNFRLIYVGQAGGKNDQKLFVRLKQHREDAVSERWSKFSWFGVRRVLESGLLKAEKLSSKPETGSVLNHIEAILIAAAEPVQNRQGGKFGDEVEQYLQFQDVENLEPKTHEILFEILRELDSQKAKNK
jgi:hypothetical protein